MPRLHQKRARAHLEVRHAALAHKVGTQQHHLAAIHGVGQLLHAIHIPVGLVSCVCSASASGLTAHLTHPASPLRTQREEASGGGTLSDSHMAVGDLRGQHGVAHNVHDCQQRNHSPRAAPEAQQRATRDRRVKLTQDATQPLGPAGL